MMEITGTLEEVAARRASIELRCKVCRGSQAADLKGMIDKHWPGCQLEHAVRLWECYWCGERGRFGVVELRFWGR